MKRISTLVLAPVLSVMLMGGVASAAPKDDKPGQAVCEGTHVQASGLSIVVTADPGMVIVGSCVKAATDVVYTTYNGVKTVTLTSGTKHEISHYTITQIAEADPGDKDPEIPVDEPDPVDPIDPVDPVDPDPIVCDLPLVFDGVDCIQPPLDNENETPVDEPEVGGPPLVVVDPPVDEPVVETPIVDGEWGVEDPREKDEVVSTPVVTPAPVVAPVAAPVAPVAQPTPVVVESTPVAAPVEPVAQLAYTGTSTYLILGLGLALLACGILLARLGRKA